MYVYTLYCYCIQNGKLKEGAANIPGEFIREGLTAVISVKVFSILLYLLDHTALIYVICAVLLYTSSTILSYMCIIYACVLGAGARI